MGLPLPLLLSLLPLLMRLPLLLPLLLHIRALHRNLSLLQEPVVAVLRRPIFGGVEGVLPRYPGVSQPRPASPARIRRYR